MNMCNFFKSWCRDFLQNFKKNDVNYASLFSFYKIFFSFIFKRLQGFLAVKSGVGIRYAYIRQYQIEKAKPFVRMGRKATGLINNNAQ